MSADEQNQPPAPGPDQKPEPEKQFFDPPLPPEEEMEPGPGTDESGFLPEVDPEEEDLIAFFIIMGWLP